jgi:choline dehydrogenase-like flavoprotein
VSERFEVVVIGSGAGGGVVAGELAQRGRNVVLLEAGPHMTAADFVRWEAKAADDFWWPLRMAMVDGGAGGVVPILGGRCVGGTTTMNTKVAFRAHDFEFAKWHRASGLLGDDGEPFGVETLARHYDRVEQVLGVRERADRPQCVRTLDRGFRELGHELEPVHSYTDHNCMKCGSCLQGCPTNAGKSTMNTYLHAATAAGKLDLRAEAPVERILFADRDGGLEATGVEYLDSAGERHTIEAGAVVVAAGALNTPQLLIRSGLPEASSDSDSSKLIGRNLGLHPAAFVFGLFDQVQDAHRVYPITSHCIDFIRDEDGGFVLEASTIQDPIGFATSIGDEDGPLWGQRLVEATRSYRHWNGILVLANDENNGRVVVGEDGGESFEAHFDPIELERMENALAFGRQVMEAAGAKRVAWTGPASTHVQGTCPMGSDAGRSVVDANCESHDAKRLFVGDASLFPRTLSVNPSMTIMALADRLAEHLHSDPNGYLEPRAAEVSVGG